MNIAKKRIVSIVVAVALILTMYVPSISNAATVYFLLDYSIDVNNPTKVNNPYIDFRGSYIGVAFSSINYKIDHMIGGVAVESKGGNNPLAGDGTFSFYFPNIELYQGLNRISFKGTDSTGSEVSNDHYWYIYYANAPYVSEVKLPNGTVLNENQPTIVATDNVTLMITAPNATNVSIKGVNAYPAGNGIFTYPSLELGAGQNVVSLVATNGVDTYTVNRTIVYKNQNPVAYNTRIVNGTDVFSLEGNPVVNENINGGTISGEVIFALTDIQDSNDPTILNPPTITYDVINSSNAAVYDDIPTTVNVTPTYKTATHVAYAYTGNVIDLDLQGNGKYTYKIDIRYNGKNYSYIMPFSYYNDSSPYITEARQLYNVNTSATPTTYSSSSSLNNGMSVLELPIWVEARVANRATLALADIDLKSYINGVEDATGFTTAGKSFTANGVAFQITSMTKGEQTLKFTIGGDEFPVVVNYIPASYFQIDNLYNGHVYNQNGTSFLYGNNKLFSYIEGRLVNFRTTDMDSVTISLNGKTVKLVNHVVTTTGVATTIGTDGKFIFDAYTAGLVLVNGPNKINIVGTANGVPITSSITVYLFSEDVPVLTNIRPVPHNIASPVIEDSTLKFNFIDTLQYVTHETEADVLFNVENVTNVEVRVDGDRKALISYDGTAKTWSGDTSKIVPTKVDADVNSDKYLLRFVHLELPKTGTTNIAVMATKGAANASQTLSITRELSPFIVESPKLPEERVINQNFLNVSIKAEGADQVLLGKVVMEKHHGDIFRAELTDLKKGINKVKFTVTQGENKINGEFEVNYVAQNIPYAQYKASIGNGGKISVFNGDISLNLPKGTLLRKINPSPGEEFATIELFDSQQVLFGIADREYGRTVVRYNEDGTFRNVLGYDVGSILTPTAHFNYASKLFWIDAGYFQRGANGEYLTTNGKHPYATGDVFNERIYGERMLEPTQRGTITLKYDSEIRDAIANTLTIVKFNGTSWDRIGGVVNAKQKTITAPFDGFGYYAVFKIAYSYDDIVGHRYAKDSLNLMFARGLMTNKDNREFGVLDNITRGEFATLLVRMLDLPLNYSKNTSNPTFLDVPHVEGISRFWDFKYIETAHNAGIVQGTSPRLFNPNGLLSREQAASMLARALNLKLGEPEKELAALQKQFTDAGTVNHYAVPSVSAISKAGYITGKPNQLTGQGKETFRFDPEAPLSRADAAVIVERVMKKLKKL